MIVKRRLQQRKTTKQRKTKKQRKTTRQRKTKRHKVYEDDDRRRGRRRVNWGIKPSFLKNQDMDCIRHNCCRGLIVGRAGCLVVLSFFPLLRNITTLNSSNFIWHLFKVIFTDQIELEELRNKAVFYEELGNGLKAKKNEDFNLELSYIMLLLML